MNKILILFSMCFLLIVQVPVNAMEAEGYVSPEVNVQYANISSIHCTISSRNGKVYPSVLVRGKKDYDMKVTLVLQKKKGNAWTNVSKWSKSNDGRRIEISKSASCTKGTIYRAVCNVTVNAENVQKISGSVQGR